MTLRKGFNEHALNAFLNGASDSNFGYNRRFARRPRGHDDGLHLGILATHRVLVLADKLLELRAFHYRLSSATTASQKQLESIGTRKP